MRRTLVGSILRTEIRSEVATEANRWSREFWSELVNHTMSLQRYENQANVWGWNIRLVWEDEGRRGVVYLHRNATGRQSANVQRDLRSFVFPTFEPRTEARLVLDRLRAVDGARRPNRG